MKVADVVVPIIDTLPNTQTNSATNGEIAQENYSPSEMFQDLKKIKEQFSNQMLRVQEKD